MNKFFTTFFASCLGTLVALTFIVLFFVVYGLVLQNNSGSIKTNSILTLDLSGKVPEKTDNVVKEYFDLSASRNLGIRHIERLLDKASKDSKISSLVIKGKSVGGSGATVSSLSSAIEKFKSSGKSVYAYSDYFMQSGYALACLADTVFLNPNGFIDLKGYGMLAPYIRELLDRYGIEAEVFYAGDFKSATEWLRRTSMSEEDRLQTLEFLKDAFGLYRDHVLSHRDLSKETFNKAVNEMSLRKSTSCEEMGFVDDLKYWDEVQEFLKQKMGVDQKKKLNYIDLQEYADIKKLTNPSKSKDKLAVVYLEGEIVYGGETDGAIDQKRYLKVLDKLSRDENVKSVVLRVNSPGGSAFTSDMIWREVERLKASGKKVIASYGDYAASGGYYISCNADTIVAMPNTLTGSIGVYSIYPNINKFLTEQAGIKFDSVKTHPFAVAFNPFMEMRDEEASIIQEETDNLYELFVSRVADGRGMDTDDVKAIASGRIWSGLDAKENGLIDVLGDLNDAITIAANSAGMEDYKVVEYPLIKEDPWRKLMQSFGPKVKEAKILDKQELQLLSEFKKLKNISGPQARLPLMWIVD